MLYENENLKLWMPETGEFTSKEEVIDGEEKRIIEEGRALEAMLRSDGWKVVNGLLTLTTTDLKEKLAYEQDIEKIRRLQEAIKAYQNVLTYVDYKIAEGRALAEQNQSPKEG
jgi:hypothetical protein